MSPTPWGDLEIYQYNGKYTAGRASIDASDVIDVGDSNKSMEFNPWQYSNLSAEWKMNRSSTYSWIASINLKLEVIISSNSKKNLQKLFWF